MLLYNNATYMQVLEGEKEDVHEIYDSILRDPRNNGNVTLVEKEISQRDFPNWSMGFKSLDNYSEEELPGFQDVFNGKLDKTLILKNTAKSVQLLMRFAEII